MVFILIKHWKLALHRSLHSWLKQVSPIYCSLIKKDSSVRYKKGLLPWGGGVSLNFTVLYQLHLVKNSCDETTDSFNISHAIAAIWEKKNLYFTLLLHSHSQYCRLPVIYDLILFTPPAQSWSWSFLRPAHTSLIFSLFLRYLVLPLKYFSYHPIIPLA